nr:immunoglobulin light chain junction region [Macaca mulatta]MOV92225.1 immunoglobulin light chain junction region [Macaca mulatta]MOV92237.1 immunoglobulin light chain junction region [Macaca mulatta]MOV92441.1 immunoglobulin light chain junction region [Macaca mulatta]MOV92535.1 immunoglobulin light chain junction region [Macaca mulatta]
CQQFHSLPFTF